MVTSFGAQVESYDDEQRRILYHEAMENEIQRIRMQEMQEMQMQQMQQMQQQSQMNDDDDDGERKFLGVLPKLSRAVSYAAGVKNIGGGEVPQMKRYALLAADVYESPETRPGDARVGGNGFQLYQSEIPELQNTEETSFYVDDQARELVVSYRGTTNMKDLWSDAMIMLSSESKNARFQEAEIIAKVARQEADRLGYVLTTTGHSLGGRLALFAGKRAQVDNIIVFNPGLAPLSIKNECGKKSKSFCRNKLVIYTTGNDFISVSSLFFSSGIRVVRVPPMKKNLIESISGAMGILKAHTMANFTEYNN